MGDFTSLSDMLAKEVLTDIAENFFGARRNMDLQLEKFEAALAELKARRNELTQAGCGLNRLLLRGRAVEAFYQAIGVDPAGFSFFSRCDLTPAPGSLPFALTARGRYLKLVLGAYETFQKATDEYLHGVYHQTPRSGGKKMLTIHYQQVLETAVALNTRIHDLNANMSPVCVLQYVKGFDPTTMEKEKILGLEPGGPGCSIDDKLAFRPINIDLLEAMDTPDLPPADQVRDRIEAFCNRHYAENTDAIKRLLAVLSEA